MIINYSCSSKKETPEQIESRKTLPSFQYKGETIYVSESDNSEGIKWGYCTDAINDAQSVENGQNNTKAIVSFINDNHGEEYAAKLCNNLVSNGFDDWYLPSQNELAELYKNKDRIGNFSGKIYLSSTQVNYVEVSGVSFFDGTIFTNLSPGDNFPCRCIRKDNK